MKQHSLSNRVCSFLQAIGLVMLSVSTLYAQDNTSYSTNANAIGGSTNTALGVGVMPSISGDGNTGAGFRALFSAGGGFRNTALGVMALYSNNNKNDNTAVGFQTLYTNTQGGGNTAIGAQALFSSDAGNNNTAPWYPVHVFQQYREAITRQSETTLFITILAEAITRLSETMPFITIPAEAITRRWGRIRCFRIPQAGTIRHLEPQPFMKTLLVL